MSFTTYGRTATSFGSLQRKKQSRLPKINNIETQSPFTNSTTNHGIGWQFSTPNHRNRKRILKTTAKPQNQHNKSSNTNTNTSTFSRNNPSSWLTMFEKKLPPSKLIEQFFAAIRAKDLRVISDLLTSDYGVQLCNYADGTGSNALLLAAQGGDPGVANLLLSAGSLHNVGDFEGTMPLHRASSLGNNEFVLKLVKRRDKAGSWADVNAFSSKGLTALMMATINGHGPVVDTLLWSGCEADKDLRDTQGNMRALDFARQWGHASIVKQITIGTRVFPISEKCRDGRASPIANPWLEVDDEASSMLVFNELQRGWRPVYLSEMEK